ncbi:MAG: DNA translocase FtsK 4TM domain-containing protein, partial [Ilumatobacteraceae bacterium]
MSDKGSRSSSPGSRGSSGRSSVKTPPSGSRRPAGKGPAGSGARKPSESSLAQVTKGREVEFWGIGLVSLGLLLILSMYAHMAGPLGTGIDKMFGWLFGLGRFALPVITIVIGVAMVRRRSIEHRVRLSVGWGINVLAILGFLHLVNGADKIVASVDAMSQAGGWFGAIIGEPLRTTVSWAGALVVLLAAGVLGTMLITDTTLPELIDIIRKRAAHLNAARDEAMKAREERAETRRRQPGMYDLEEEPAPAPAPRRRRESPEIFDYADDEPAPKPERRPRKPAAAAPVDPEFHQKPGMKHRGEDPLINPAAPASPGEWVLPGTELLGLTEVHEVNKARVAERGRLLEEALASHGVETRLLGMTVGPTVTRFELELGAGVKVAKVTSLNRDIAYSMAATDVRILAPIPGKSAIGVEVPNESRQLVSLGDLMVSPEAKAASHPLEVAVGKDIAGRAVFMNLASTPHMLIAGATGAGKSSGINSILTSLLMRSTPDQVRLILIDPKQVEMGQYARLPHLLTAPVTNPKKAANALGWAVKEMERRYDLLVEVGFRDIGGYNQAFDRGEVVQEREGFPPYERLPFIVV